MSNKLNNVTHDCWYRPTIPAFRDQIQKFQQKTRIIVQGSLLKKSRNSNEGTSSSRKLDPFVESETYKELKWASVQMSKALHVEAHTLCSLASCYRESVLSEELIVFARSLDAQAKELVTYMQDSLEFVIENSTSDEKKYSDYALFMAYLYKKRAAFLDEWIVTLSSLFESRNISSLKIPSIYSHLCKHYQQSASIIHETFDETFATSASHEGLFPLMQFFAEEYTQRAEIFEELLSSTNFKASLSKNSPVLNLHNDETQIVRNFLVQYSKLCEKLSAFVSSNNNYCQGNERADEKESYKVIENEESSNIQNDTGYVHANNQRSKSNHQECNMILIKPCVTDSTVSSSSTTTISSFSSDADNLCLKSNEAHEFASDNIDSDDDYYNIVA